MRHRFIVLCGIAVCAAAFGAAAKRGRVQVVDRKILTDKGTILRGCYFVVDITGDFPQRQEFHDMATVYGLNAVHLYLETFWQAEENAGMYEAQGDSAVKLAGEIGLYVVLNVGCGNRNGESSLKGTSNFWKHYAPRYKDEPHVIYELQNEPCGPMPYPDSTIQLEREVYQLIRDAAPETHVSLFSFIGLADPQSALATIEAVDDIVDWSNASVAYHSYRPSAEALDSVSARYPCINTEFWGGGTVHPNTDIIADHERRGIGWLSFVNVKQIATAFKGDIDAAGVQWAPDFGTWPSAAVSTRGLRPAHGARARTRAPRQCRGFTANGRVISSATALDHMLRVRGEDGLAAGIYLAIP